MRPAIGLHPLHPLHPPQLEQPGCVHAHMDLLKMSLRLAPWLEAELLADCLEVHDDLA